MRSRNNQTPAIRVSAHSLASLAVFVKAFHYACTAEEDERNRFPYTAAMEWSHAAELFGTTTPAADYCWRQWERIMQLPRRLAGRGPSSPRRSEFICSCSVRSPALLIA